MEYSRQTDAHKKPVPDWAHLTAGDCLINSTGVGTLGRVAYVSSISSRTTFDSHVTLVRLQKDQCVPAYVGLSLHFREKEIELLAGGSTGQTELSRDAVGALPLTLPPLAEQKRIVDVAASIDTYIAALQQQAVNAQSARNAVLHELLAAGGDGWTETTLGEAASINPREAALNQNAPFIPMDAVHVGKRFAQYLEPRGERSGARAKGGDILFARITPCLENGKVAQVPPNVERCGGSTEFIVIRGSALTSPDFLYFWATWSDTRVRAAGLMTGTTGRQRLSAGDLGALPLLLPPFSEQNRIVETVSAMDELVYSTEQAIAEAQKLRSGLLSSLLSGEHEIPETYDRLLGAA
jgi:type I restriction enzyme S subunit